MQKSDFMLDGQSKALKTHIIA